MRLDVSNIFLPQPVAKLTASSNKLRSPLRHKSFALRQCCHGAAKRENGSPFVHEWIERPDEVGPRTAKTGARSCHAIDFRESTGHYYVSAFADMLHRAFNLRLREMDVSLVDQ